MLKVFAGPMFAGKTTALLQEAEKLPPGSFIFLKPSIDDRYSETEVVTHDGRKIAAQMISATDPIFPKIPDQIKSILIDEVNFFDFPKLQEQIEQALKQGKKVFAAGLLYDFRHQPFGATLPLKDSATEFVELFAKCDLCDQPANHSYRKVGGGDQVLVGAQESYGACCEVCWEVLQKKQGA